MESPTALEDLAVFEDDGAWVDENRDALIRDYSNQWIAVRRGQVIAYDTDFDALVSRLPDAARTVVEFVNPEEFAIVL